MGTGGFVRQLNGILARDVGFVSKFDAGAYRSTPKSQMWRENGTP